MKHLPSNDSESGQSPEVNRKVNHHQEIFLRRFKDHLILGAIIVVSVASTLVVTRYPGTVKIEWPGGKFELNGKSDSPEESSPIREKTIQHYFSWSS